MVHERVKDATDGSQSVRLVHQQAKAHERIIWSCDWLPGDQVRVVVSLMMKMMIVIVQDAMAH